MSIFRSLFFTAVLVGLIVGSVVTLVQYVGTTPLILAAEVYEVSEPAVETHSHDAAAATDGHSHDHGEAWAPADGWQRNGATLVANILTAIGFALVLNGLMQVVGQGTGKGADWRSGLVWGLCGFVTVMLAPSFGLHPELPGTPAADLFDRQVWWIGTALATAAGLGLLFLVRRPWAAALAILLIALPHLIGAPLPPHGETALAPAELSHRFITVATLTSLLFWALLGSLSGYFSRRFAA